MKSQFEPTTVQPRDGAVAAHSPTPAERIFTAARRLEPVVVATLAAVTGWLAATSMADLPVLWMFCALAAAVALWAELRRPAGQPEQALRALVLLAATYVLQTQAGLPGGAADVFFLWLALTSLYYVFVLKTPFGALIAFAAVAEFTLAALWVGEDRLSSLAVRGAFLLILPMLLAMKLGALVRRPSTRLSRARTDSSTALYNRGGLLAHGQVLLATCRAERRDLTLAVFDCNDLLEARTLYGSRTSRMLIASIVRKLTLLAADEGLAARTGPTQFAVAMPISRDKALQAIERVLGNPGRFELDGKSEIVLVPHLMAETVAEDGSLERLFNALCRGLSRVQEEEAQRQRYLQRQRERHSRPMPIQPSVATAPVAWPARTPRLDPDPVFTQQIPSTIPMPLSMR